MKKAIIFFLLSVIVLQTQAIYRTPEAGRFYYWLFSPELLSRSIGAGGTDNPSGFIINPASNAFIQQFKIETSYGIAPGLMSAYYSSNNEQFLNAADFFWPFMLNLGTVIPSRYGNFTIYANYLNMGNMSFGFTNNNDLGIGKIGSFYFGFSKDYSDNFAFGFSGNLKFSYNPQSKYVDNKFDIGGGIDLGFIFRPEWYVPFSKNNPTNWAWQDYEFALTIKDVGKPLINLKDGPNGNNDLYWFPAPFTPAFGFSVNLYNNGSTYWKILTDLSTPFFQNLTISLGTEIQIFKFLVLRTSYTFDLEGVLEYIDAQITDIPGFNTYEYVYNLANVGFGISIRFRSDFLKKQTKEEAYQNRYKTTAFSIDLGARPYHQGFIFEAGCTITIGVKDETPPVINYIQRDTYASPNLDGKNDEIVIDLDIKDERYIVYWKLEIYNEKNNIVRTIESKEQRKENMKFKDVMKKYFSPKSSIPVPRQIIWDCRDNNGNIVKDGTYRFKFYAMDDNKNINKEGSREGKIIIDTDKPDIESEVTNTIFSPNNDGSKDFLIIDLDIIKDQVVSVIEPIEIPGLINIKEVPLPEMIKEQISSGDDLSDNGDQNKKQIWYVDILNASDQLIKQYIFTEKGKVQIKWDGKDQNGNPCPDGIYKLKLHSEDEAGNYWEKIISNIIINTEPTPIEATILNKIFSPNGDKVNDEVGFKFIIPITNGIESWKFEILNSKNEPVKTFNGVKIPVNEMKWDGKMDNGNVANEGDYKGKLTLVYVNGNTPDALTPVFSIDLTPPNGTVTIAKNIFSPDGDGNQDEIRINQSASEEEEWNGLIYNAANKVVKSYTWKNTPPKAFAWDGKDNNNKLLEDGTYFYQITSTDLAGNYFQSPKNEIKIFTKDTPVFITASLESFSPNNDKIKDAQIFEIHAKISKENRVAGWKIDILDDRDKSVFTVKKDGDLPENYTWNGINSSGKSIGDGFYSAALQVNFESGTSSKSKTQTFSIDTVAPQIEITATTKVFSPNNDGNLDVLEILQKGSEEDQWEAAIYNKENQPVWKKFMNGLPDNRIVWNGKDNNGNTLKNGYFRYFIQATDKAGNNAKAEIDQIEIKNVYTPVFLTLKDNKFSPNNDGKYDVLIIQPVVTYKDDLAVYKLEIVDEKNNTVKIYQGKDKLPESFEWDGTDTGNKMNSDGIYKARLTVLYSFGNKPMIESARFTLDNTPPEFDVSYNPKYFSPDDDGNDDELTINIKSSDLTGIKDWKLSILNPDETSEFNSFSGKVSVTDHIIWDGKSFNGELVESAEDYPVTVYAEDEVGNILNKEVEPIMVDILVIKLPDGRLKIKISNIQFQPDSAEMTPTPKNKKILDLIANALKKYRQYGITVEGHANKFREGLNETTAKELSELRAKTVVAELNRRGVSGSRMTIIGKGFDVPIVPLTQDAKQEDLAKNRRVEFYLEK